MTAVFYSSPSPGWSNANVAAVATGLEQIVAVWKQSTLGNELVYSFWHSSGGWNKTARELDLIPKGNPALVSRHPNQWTVFVRDQDDYIQVRERNAGTLGEWETVPGVDYYAASDPAVVSNDPHYMAVFFKDADGTVKFSEWQSGVGWRDEPISLGTPSGTQIASQLSVVSRNENHIAVFGVGSDNALWYREWTSQNESDWSDTQWVQVMENVKTNRVSVGSRHSGHMAVAVWRTAGYITYREWTAESGWGTKRNVGDPGFPQNAPPTLASTSADEMWLLGVDTSGNLKRRKVTEGSWTGWSTIESGWKGNQTLAAVVRRPFDVMVVGRTSGSAVVSNHRTSQGRSVTKSTITNNWGGTERGQVVATVDGRTIWVSTYFRTSENKWVIVAKDTTRGWIGSAKYLDHAETDTNTGKVSAAAGDVDGDGDDEVVVATFNRLGRGIDISVIELSVTDSGVKINRQEDKRVRQTWLPIGTDVNVAVGDLDGDGIENEIVVGYRYQWTYPPALKVFVYQYQDDDLQFREVKDLTYGDGGSHIPNSYASTEDMELTIGQVRLDVGEQLVVAVQARGIDPNYQEVYIAQYGWEEDQRGDWKLRELEVETPREFAYALGEYTTALITADTDGDGLEEIIYSRGQHWAQSGYNRQRSLAAGDIDWDGKAEIVYATGSGDGKVRICGRENGNNWSCEEKTAEGVALVADLDGDSQQADLVGCASFKEVSVIAVVNGAPRHYQNDEPIHGSEEAVANSSSTSSGAEDGWHVNVGGSLSVGFEVEILCLVTKIGEARASVTMEFMDTIMGATETHESTTDTIGYSVSGASRGMVVYDETGYRCYYYDVYNPDDPTITTRAMACTSSSAPSQKMKPLKDWHDTDFKDAAGSSWVDVGRLDNDVTTYPSTIPQDAYMVRWHGAKITVQGIVDPNTTAQVEWSTEQSQGGAEITGNSWDLNTTLSVGATLGGLTGDLSVTGGYGEDWSRSIGWEESLHIGGLVEFFQEGECSECRSYTVTPYMHQATAKTAAGATYPYFEVDYYVPDPPGTLPMNKASAAGLEEVLELAPQTPIITSTTHPDPNTWYPTSTVTFDWSQPVGDPAVVAGYHWNLDQSETTTPTSILTVLSQTHTYKGVADGVYYLHLLAVGDGGDESLVAHQAARVDTSPPQVEFAHDPMVPTGLNDWYNTPVTVTIVATDGAGSGVSAIEYSTDESTWLPYTTTLIFATEIPSITLWARATDNVGYISDSVSTTIKVDMTSPTLLDQDGYRLSYASIITDDVGNAQLVLGGALSDTLSGRLMTEIKLGDSGLWRPVSAVGEFPMPPENEFSTTITSLNWIYTPTFEARGAWTIWGRGTDRAGNTTEPFDIAGFYWEPDDAPDLVESLVSVAPSQVYPGDVVTFTLGVRNTGYQESKIVLTNTLPAELTVLTDTISSDGHYDASDGVITWTLEAVWPGETRYLFFSAQVDAGLALTEPLTLENRLDVLGYWVWEDPYGVMPDEPPAHSAVATTTLTVLTGTMTSASPPQIMVAEVEEGAVVNDQQVTLFVEASTDAEFIYVKEWVWDTISDTWTLAQESGWVSFEEADGFEVSEDAWAKRGWYQWMLSEGDGIKYIGVWVTDADQQTTNLNDANLIYTNLMGSGGQTLDAGERVQYRVPLRANDLTIFNLVTLSGDADLYVWKPRFAFRPHYLSNASETGFHIDTVGFFAEEEGVHVVEVEAASDGTYYRLVTAGDMPSVGLLAETRAVLTADQRAALQAQDAAMRTAYETLPRSVHLPLQEKERPAHPLSLSTPYRLGDTGVLPDVPKVPEEPTEYAVYLPLVLRSE
jgi:uncharacterized repeat protein (TIGR01451 family)